jgi:hypothetical protein
MRENCLEVRLEAEKERVGQFMLTAEAVSAHYAMNLDPAASFEFSDALRRLGPALAGRRDPAGQLAPLVMREVGVRLWQALLPNTAPAQERDALAQALRSGLSPLLLTLPDTLGALPWELLCDPDVPDELIAAALRELGTIAQLQGDYPEARRLLYQSLAIFERLGDVAGQAASLRNLGTIAQLQGPHVVQRERGRLRP